MGWILLPIVTEKENDADFLQKVSGASKVILLYVVDGERMGGVKTSAVGEKMAEIQKLMGEIRKKITDASAATAVEEKIEWGNWLEKLLNVAAMEKIDSVLLFNSVFSHELAAGLREKGFAVVIA